MWTVVLDILEVLAITVPVFAMIGFGALLRRTGMLNDAAHGFISRFAYLFCLPVLIFLGVARQDFAQLLNGPVIASTLLASAAGLVAFLPIARSLPQTLRGPVAVSSWFGNLTFLGFPLAKAAYGEMGEGFAGVINAFTMPAYVVVGVVVLSAGQARQRSLARQVAGAVCNPIVLSALAGLVGSLVFHSPPVARAVAGSVALQRGNDVVVGTLELVGSMGLPLPLLAIGASLRIGYVRGHLPLMTLGTLGKLLLTPALTLVLCVALFPGMDPAARGTAVLLMACPLSVGVWVISQGMKDTDSDYLAGLLVLSTASASITAPAWLYVLKLLEG